MSIILNRFFATLAFLNMIERASYYGFQGIFVIYLVNNFGFSQEKTYDLYGVFFTLIYTLPLLIGYLLRNHVHYSPFLKWTFFSLSVGFVLVSFSDKFCLYSGLIFILFGISLFKIISPGLLGRFYDLSPELSRDSGFTYMYIFMNIGTVFSFLIVGWVGEKISWKYALYIIAILNVISLLLTSYLKNRPLNHRLQKRDNKMANISSLYLIKTSGLILLPFVILFLMFNATLFNIIFSCSILIISVGCILYISSLKGSIKQHVIGVCIVILSFILYLGAFNQKENSINSFTYYHIDRFVSNFEIPTVWYLSINPIIVFIFGSMVAELWTYLNNRKKEPNFALKLSIAWVVMGISYFFYYRMATDALQSGKTHMYFLIIGHILISFSEILALPLIFSWITKLSPQKMKTTFIGLATFAGAGGNFLAAQIAKLTIVNQPAPDEIGEVYSTVYWNIAIFSIVIGMIMFILGKRMKKYFLTEELL